MLPFKFILIISFVLFNSLVFSQSANNIHLNSFYNTDKATFDLDISAVEKRSQEDPQHIYIYIYYINTRIDKSLSKVAPYQCIDNYNSELYEISFNNYTGDVTEFAINLKNNKGVKYDPIKKQPFLYIFCANDSIKSLIENNLSLLYLAKFQNDDGVKYYTTNNTIDSPEMFCWKLNQILNFFENHKEILNHKSDDLIVEQKIEKSIAVNLHSAFPIFNAMASTNKMYKNSISMNSIPIFLGLDVQFVKKNFSFGLGVFHSTFNFNNSLKNTSYTIDWSNANIKGDNFKAIDFKNVKEMVTFSNYNLYIPLTYSLGLNKQKSMFFDINSKLIYALPFVLKSKLISGEFSYRGKIEGINDELANIPSLGFIENDQSIIGQASELKMHGYGFNLGLNMRYNYRSFSAKFGVAYYSMGYRNLQYQSESYITKQISDYQSSFFGVKNISSNSLALSFGIGYIIK